MKFLIYHHTHWDREWYFSDSVSQMLLINNLNLYLKQKNYLNCFYLDGQWSILLDYWSKTSKNNQKKLLNLIKKNQIKVGPWYTQPDFFNSLGQSVIRNLTIGKYWANKYHLKNSDVVYCPDSFGFPNNLVQIFNLFHFKNFLFWRGIDHSFKQSSFIWKTNLNHQVKAYYLHFGYFVLGHFIDWKNLTDQNYLQTAKTFVEKFLKSSEYQYFKNLNEPEILLGCGHDQAVPYQLLSLFWIEVNKLLANKTQDVFEINYQDAIFENKQKFMQKSWDRNLDYGYISKIHRTIASTRTLFKQLFRQNEITLYHQLEPLQLKMKHMLKGYDTSHNLLTTMQLLKMQAHDILGGCVSDEVYLESFFELKKTLTTFQSDIAFLMRTYAQFFKLDQSQLLIFNPQLNFNSPNITKKIISCNKKYKGYYEDEKIVVYVNKITKNKLIFKLTYDHEIIIVNKKLEPHNFYVFDLNKLENNFKYKSLNLKEVNAFSILVEKDNGDTYDFDPVENSQKIFQFNKQQNYKVNNLEFNNYIFEIYYNQQKQKIEIEQISFNNSSQIFLKSKNQIKNARFTLLFNEMNFDYQCSYLQCLKMEKVHIDDFDWKKLNYKENPVNNYRTEGLIRLGEKVITSLGNNEFYFYKNKLGIVLWRNIGYLGKANLVNRPGLISGLSSKYVLTPLAQNKNEIINCEFGIYAQSCNNSVANSWFKKPIIFHPQSNDVEKDKNGQFIIEPNLKIFQVKKNFKIKNNFFVANSWINYENKPEFIFVNLDKEETENLKENQLKVKQK